MEGYGPETYGDAIADTYDLWYGTKPDTTATVDRLVSLADRTSGRPVLELGIGTGRLALPLSERDVEVWGIDASSAMVDQLRDKPNGTRPKVVVGDMAELDLTALPGGDSVRFGVVYVAINTFFNLTTREAQLRCLQRVHDVLADDGRFVLEAFVPSVDRPTNLVEARTVAVDHVILTATRHDPEEQIVECQYIEIRESGIKLRPLRIRYCPPAELDAMAEAAGLELVDRWSDWTGSPFGDGDGTHVSVYARSAS